ncbi:hypothetical protein ACI65C_010546 [Semiaphis heraclei]
MEPIRYHTQHIERSWRELKRVLTRCNCPRVSTSYIGEWMYRTNILSREGGIQQQFCRFMRDIGRAYPGIGYIPITRDIEDLKKIDLHMEATGRHINKNGSFENRQFKTALCRASTFLCSYNYNII